jgi:hypothetical protein
MDGIFISLPYGMIWKIDVFESHSTTLFSEMLTSYVRWKIELMSNERQMNLRSN